MRTMEAPVRATVAVGSQRLAVLRIVAGLLAAWFGWGYKDLTLPPAELRFFPFFADLHLPVSQTLITVAAVAAMVGGVAVAVGFYHRWFGWVAAAGFTYLGWLTTYTGKVNHSHHILWFLILVTVAPAASAWAVRKAPVRGSVKWAVTGFCVVLGLIYFGAGLAKVVHVGWDWGATLVDRVDVINGQKGLPGAPDWMHGWVGTVMGSGALAFELLFLPFIVWTRTRKYVWPAGVVFHLATWWIMGISFWTLLVFYLVFLPWRDGTDREPTRLQTRVTLVLCSLIAVAALAGIEAGWPIAAYPSFKGDVSGGEQAHVYADGVEIYEVPGGDLAHAVNSIINGKADEYAAWLGVDRVELVVESG